MTVRELYEELDEYVQLEGNKEVAIKFMMEDYSTFDISLYNDGDRLYIEID